MSYRAWWTYWITVAVWFAVAVGIAVARVRVGASQPLWVAGLTIPPIIAGIDLILFRGSHEQVCAVEARQHAWLGALVGRGYSARTFLITGITLVAFAVVLALALLQRT